jgi:hypothetical protein
MFLSGVNSEIRERGIKGGGITEKLKWIPRELYLSARADAILRVALSADDPLVKTGCRRITN